MDRKKMLPIGVEDFKKIRTSNYYYIDKTEMIRELLGNLGDVNLFTRPRRFGKTLNMSMLEYFFLLKPGRSCSMAWPSRKRRLFVKNIWASIR